MLSLQGYTFARQRDTEFVVNVLSIRSWFFFFKHNTISPNRQFNDHGTNLVFKNLSAFTMITHYVHEKEKHTCMI